MRNIYNVKAKEKLTNVVSQFRNSLNNSLIKLMRVKFEKRAEHFSELLKRIL